MLSRIRGPLAIAALVIAAGNAQAGVIGAIVTITATDGTNTGSWTGQVINWNPGPNDPQTWSWASNWTNGGPQLIDPNTSVSLGRLNRVEMGFVGDPVINQLFAVQAGNSTTKFTISSAILTFDTGDYYTTGSAQMGVTDTNGNGATVTGQFGTDCFRWLCDNQVIGSGIGGFATGPNTSSNPQTVLIPNITYFGVSSMQSEFSFLVSAGDIATGSSNYQKIPTPGAVALLGLGGLVATRRRR